MRTTRQLPAGTPIETDFTEFPDSTVIDEVPGQEGTPVVREIYGDVLTNIYNLLRITGVVANGIEDSESNGYQLVEALRKLTNTQNDTERVLTLNGSVFSADLDFSKLPNKYFFFAKATGAFVAGTAYTIKGIGAAPAYNLISTTGFTAGSEVLVILDQTGARVFSVGSGNGSGSSVSTFTPFGTPLAYNDTKKVWYQEEGILFADTPESYDIQSAVRVFESDGTVIVYEMFIIAGYLLCLTFRPGTGTYRFYRFTMANLSAAPVLMNMTSPGFVAGADRKPFAYTDGTNLYLTNTANNSVNDYAINSYLINMAAGTLTGSGNCNLTDFIKTTNAVIFQNRLFTFVAGIVKQYNIVAGSGVLSIVEYTTFIGNLFLLNGDVYYTNGEVATKWTLSVI